MSLIKAETIVNKIEKLSFRPIENRPLILRYVNESLTENKPVTFYNWECPPRKISTAKKGLFFVDYDLNLKYVFQGKKIDAFTEIPRVVESKDREISILTSLQKLDFPFRFVKLIADTNAYYLTPESFPITGKQKTLSKFSEFKSLVESAVSNYPIKTRVSLFTKVFKPFSDTYQNTFNLCRKILKKNPGELISVTVFKEQLTRTKKHIGITEKNWALDFSLRTIATYAAEGIIFDQLSKTDNFSNCVWLNNHEMDRRTIEITNCYRKKLGISNLPMVFWK